MNQPVESPTVFRLKAQFLRTLYYDQETKRKKYAAVVKVEDIPEDLDKWSTVNPRSAKTTGKVPEKMEDTLENEPGEFYWRNLGIYIIADDVCWIPKRDQHTNKQLQNDGELIVTLTDKKKHGVLNGGHTRAICSEHRDKKAFVQFFFFTFNEEDEEDFVVPLADSLNSFQPVRDESLADLAGDFDSFKEALPTLKKVIFFHENEKDERDQLKPVSIIDAIRCASMVNPYVKRPERFYNAKSNIIRAINHKENEDEWKKMKKMAYNPFLEDVLKLHDFILESFEKVYNESGGRLKRCEWFKPRISKDEKEKKEKPVKEKNLYYLNKKAPIGGLTPGRILPFLASFRAFVEFDKDDHPKWINNFDPREEFKKENGLGTELMMEWKSQLEFYKGNPDTNFQKSPRLYNRLISIAEKYRKENYKSEDEETREISNILNISYEEARELLLSRRNK